MRPFRTWRLSVFLLAACLALTACGLGARPAVKTSAPPAATSPAKGGASPGSGSTGSAAPAPGRSTPSPTGAAGLVSMRPGAGPPGTVVTFTGVGLGTSPGRVAFVATTATGEGTDLAIRAWTPTRIEAVVPGTLAAGNYTPQLWTAAGTRVGPTGEAAWPIFTVTGPKPVVTGLSPANAPAGSLLTITGEYFGSAPGRVTLCQFCGTPSQIVGTATIVSWTPTQVQARVPGMQNGGAEVHLTTAAGQVVLAGHISTGQPYSPPGGQASG